MQGFFTCEISVSRLELNWIIYCHNNTILVIAQIKVVHKRQGTGLEILNFLKKYGKENGYSKIVAETVLSPEFQIFLLKNQFKEQENNILCYELPLV